MAKDPICGMDVKEEGALHFLHFAHETLYFCSKTCKETYSQQSGMGKPTAKKGIFGRFNYEFRLRLCNLKPKTCIQLF